MTLQTRWQSTQPKTFYQRTPHRMQHKGNVSWGGRATRNTRVTLSKHKSRDSSFKTLGNKSMNRPPKLEVWKQEDGGNGEKASVLFGTMITCHLSWAYTRSYHHQRTLDQDRDGKVSGVEKAAEKGSNKGKHCPMQSKLCSFWVLQALLCRCRNKKKSLRTDSPIMLTWDLGLTEMLADWGQWTLRC